MNIFYLITQYRNLKFEFGFVEVLFGFVQLLTDLQMSFKLVCEECSLAFRAHFHVK